MAPRAIELATVGMFAIAAEKAQPSATAVLDVVRPEMIEDRVIREYFQLFAERFVAGDSPLGAEAMVTAEERGFDPGFAVIGEIEEYMIAGADPSKNAEYVRKSWQNRELVRLLGLAAGEAAKSVENRNGRGQRIAEKIAMRCLELYASGSERRGPQTREELIADQLAGMDATVDGGITVPWPKLERSCGPWMPGDVIGISAFSGSGKSTVAANLFNGFIAASVPVIAFPSEMREQWLARAVAAESWVPQWRAEKRLWRGASDTERDNYRTVLGRMQSQPWEIVNRPNISPAEVVSAVRVIRKRWAGQTVVVIVDHMHRLDYGGEKPNEAVGPATKLMKNFAGSDREGGLIVIALFQPSKPGQGTGVYRPVAGHEIRGNSEVWNEIDVHLSPYRALVHTDGFKNDWGEPRTRKNLAGVPVVAKKKGEDVKPDDEHYWIKVDKRRVGGEGPTVILDFHAPSGRIFEAALFGAQELPL